jgi:hypothetical protein
VARVVKLLLACRFGNAPKCETDDEIRSLIAVVGMALGEATYEQAEGMVRRLMQTQKFWPAPAELRAALGEVTPRWADAAYWGLGRCDVCGRPAGMLDRGRRACWGHVDQVFPDSDGLAVVA